MEDQGTDLVEWLSATGALIPVLVGLLALAVTFWRRPNLSLHLLREHSRVERSPDETPLPYVRLVARNGRWHRAAHGTRVLVEHVQPAGGERTYLGSPPLGWTSAADAVNASVVIFPGGERPVDLGAFESYIRDEGKDEWALRVAPYVQIFEGRDVLPAVDGGYSIRLVVGSDDGRARRYNVHVDWDPTKRLLEPPTAYWTGRGPGWNAEELLASVTCRVTRVR